MTEDDRNKYINMRYDRGDDEVSDGEVRESFAQDQELDHGGELAKRRQQQHTDQSSELAASDLDATWDDADGEEAGSGTTSTPDENVVEEVGGAVGISYSDTEPLNTNERLERRDHDRWDLNPASDPEYQDRIKEEFHEPQAPDVRARKHGLGENHTK
jgi:Family of unknown function (DUF6335)